MCKTFTLLTSQQITKSLGVVGQKLTDAQTCSIITSAYNHAFSEKTDEKETHKLEVHINFTDHVCNEICKDMKAAGRGR